MSIGRGRPHVFDPKSFTAAQLAYRLGISTTGAYCLLVDLIEMGVVEQEGRGRYALRLQGKRARVTREAE